ncbi:hypothetical protein D3C80_1872190 [compost metagenome]
MIVFRGTDQRQSAVAAQQVKERVQIVLGCDGVKNKVEAVGVLRHLFRVTGNDHFVGTEAFGILDFGLGGSEQHYMRAHRPGQFDPHMS